MLDSQQACVIHLPPIHTYQPIMEITMTYNLNTGLSSDRRPLTTAAAAWLCGALAATNATQPTTRCARPFADSLLASNQPAPRDYVISHAPRSQADAARAELRIDSTTIYDPLRRLFEEDLEHNSLRYPTEARRREQMIYLTLFLIYEESRQNRLATEAIAAHLRQFTR